MEASERRQYVRHPIRVPITVRPVDGSPRFRAEMGDLSEGGLSFAGEMSVRSGSSLEVELPVQDQCFRLTGRVARCVPGDAGRYHVGLAFVEPDQSFRMKLAEQVLRISRLQRELSAERGRSVSEAEAAQHWVERYAEVFADGYAR